jgi:hypothetical protein
MKREYNAPKLDVLHLYTLEQLMAAPTESDVTMGEEMDDWT